MWRRSWYCSPRFSSLSSLLSSSLLRVLLHSSPLLSSLCSCTPISPRCPLALLSSALLAVLLRCSPLLSSLFSCTPLLCSPRCPPTRFSSALLAVLLHCSPLLSSLASYTSLLCSARCSRLLSLLFSCIAFLYSLHCPSLLSFALLLLPCFKTTGETSNGVTTGEAHRPIARLHASSRFSLWQNARVA